jgi:hypothetical protein
MLGSRGVRPRQARYQAALRPDMHCFTHSKHFPTLLLIRTIIWAQLKVSVSLRSLLMQVVPVIFPIPVRP